MRIIVCTALCLLGLGAQAEEKKLVWTPTMTRAALMQIQSDGETERLKAFISPEVVEAMDWYANSNQIDFNKVDKEEIAASTARAFTKGVVRSVVETLATRAQQGNDMISWNNSETFNLPENVNLLEYASQENPMVFNSWSDEFDSQIHSEKQNIPIAAQTPEVATEEAGYQAAKWVMKKLFGKADGVNDFMVDPTYFDLEPPVFIK